MAWKKLEANIQEFIEVMVAFLKEHKFSEVEVQYFAHSHEACGADQQRKTVLVSELEDFLEKLLEDELATFGVVVPGYDFSYTGDEEFVITYPEGKEHGLDVFDEL